jgi:hypothetical protein
MAELPKIAPTRIEVRAKTSLVLHQIEDSDLVRILHAGRNHWETSFHVCAAACVPLWVNWMGSGAKFTDVHLASLDAANLIFGGALLVAAIICGIAWWKTSTSLTAIIKEIQDRPAVASSDI